MTRTAVVALAGMALFTYCSSSTDADGPGHPEGLIFATPPLSGQPYGVAISRNDAVIVARVFADSITRFDLPDTLSTLSRAAGAQPVHVAINPDGTTAYVVNQSGQAVRVVNLVTNTVTTTIPLTNDGFNIIVSPDGQRVYTTTADGRVYVISTSSDAIVDSMRVGSASNGLAFAPNGNRLYVSSRDAGAVTVFDPQTNAPLDTIIVGGAPQRLAVAPDGTRLYVANEVSGVNVVQLPSGTLLPGANPSGSGYGLGITPDGAHLYLTDAINGTLTILQRDALTVVNTFPVAVRPVTSRSIARAERPS